MKKERLISQISSSSSAVLFGRKEQLDKLHNVFEEASKPDTPKGIVFVYGESGLSKRQLVELAFLGTNTSAAEDVIVDRTSMATTKTTTATNNTSTSYGSRSSTQYNKTSQQFPTSSCWYGYGKFTPTPEDKPYSELSTSLGQIVTQQLLPYCRQSTYG